MFGISFAGQKSKAKIKWVVQCFCHVCSVAPCLFHWFVSRVKAHIFGELNLWCECTYFVLYALSNLCLLLFPWFQLQSMGSDWLDVPREQRISLYVICRAFKSRHRIVLTTPVKNAFPFQASPCEWLRDLWAAPIRETNKIGKTVSPHEYPGYDSETPF